MQQAAGTDQREGTLGELREECQEILDMPGRHNWWCATARQARRMAEDLARQLGPDWSVDHDARPRPHYHPVRLFKNVAGQWVRQRLRNGGHFFYGGNRPRRIKPRDRRTVRRQGEVATGVGASQVQGEWLGETPKTPSKEQLDLLRAFFGRDLEGARHRARNWYVPPGLETDTLKWYRGIAQRALGDPKKATEKAVQVQGLRLVLVRRALRERGAG